MDTEKSWGGNLNLNCQLLLPLQKKHHLIYLNADTVHSLISSLKQRTWGRQQLTQKHSGRSFVKALTDLKCHVDKIANHKEKATISNIPMYKVDFENLRWNTFE